MHPHCSLFHILVGCDVALKQKRYTWRHDCVLAVLKPVLEEHVSHVNSKVQTTSTMRSIKFISSRTNHCCPHPIVLQADLRNVHILDLANDWQLLIDFDHCRITFPVEILITDERPDIIIWSCSSRSVVLVELTCPAEENIGDACSRKTQKYTSLCTSIESKGWVVYFFSIEVGCRGFPARSIPHCLSMLGVDSNISGRLMRTLSSVVSSCSFTIFRCHNVREWLYQPPNA